jgi:alpha-galactosidase
MPITLESSHFRFTLDPERASWSLQPARERYPALQTVHMQAAYRLGRQSHTLLEHWPGADISTPETLVSPHGLLHSLRLNLPPDSHGLRAEFTFALHPEQPCFLWRLSLHNTGSQPLTIDRLTLLSCNLKSEISNPKFFSNGWGSWNYTGAYGPTDRPRRTRLGFLAEPLHANAGTPRPRQAGHFASEMFAVLGDMQRRSGLLLGFLSQLEHFGSLEADLRPLEIALRLWASGDGARLDPGASTSTDWACLFLIDVDDPDPLGAYLKAVFLQSTADNQQPNLQSKIQNLNSRIPTGWCSWYHFYQNVTAADIRRNLEFATQHRAGLPLDLIQIDDGFETIVGDWYTFRRGFPDGPAPLAREIRAAGFTPGLWLAPFIVDPRSRLAKEHPDWLLRGRFNRPVNAGFIWNTLTTALDPTYPAALDYACQLIHTAAHEWGFPYLKLDFLYAAALPGRYHNPTKTRAQALRAGLQALREAAGTEIFLLGCGCPLGPGIGLFEAMRIGADVAPNWHPQFANIEFFFKPEPDMPSARNAIQNSLTRAALHRRWWLNDPDCLLARETQLNLPEIQSLATVIALSGGLLLLSDDLPALPPERLELLLRLFPAIGKTPCVLDWLDSATPARLRLDLDGPSGSWSLLALFNWQDTQQLAALRLADYRLDLQDPTIAREFWSDTLYPPTVKPDSSAETGQVFLPPHGVALFAVRRLIPDQPAYLGSSLHISQGLELSAWQPRPDGLSLRLERPGEAQGCFDLYLPRTPHIVQMDGHPVRWEEIAPRCYRLHVTFQQQAVLSINY